MPDFAVTVAGVLQPNILGVAPTHGPVAGDTVLTISGDHLDIFKLDAVFVGSMKCRNILAV